MSEWHENAGRCPTREMGKRVAVELRNGQRHGEKPVSPTSPAGWPADGKGGCRWTFTKGPPSYLGHRVVRVLDARQATGWELRRI